MRQRGFTLIELLVVISIIALLSSIILAGVQEARAKGRNAERLQIVNEYRTALELARDADGRYPQATDFSCVGNPASGTCFGGRPVLPALVTALAPFISAYPLAPAPPSRPTYTGMQYFTCPGGPSPFCTDYAVPSGSYSIWWFMEGVAGTCGPGTLTQSSLYLDEGIRLCVYVHQ